MRRALIATLPPTPGGVSAMQRTALRLLAERGYEATLAWYEPYSWSPRLSVPAYRLGTRRVAAEARPVAGAAAGRAVGAWLPELEFTHYWPTAHWRELIRGHDAHLVVSGTCLAGLAFARTGTPFLAWIASDWHGDRKDRVARFPAVRKLLDRLVTRPVARRLEPRILRSGRLLALSEPTRRELDRVAGAPVVRDVLPSPIDVERFRPDPSAVVRGRIGFVGRFDDPRKNLSLYLASLQAARRRAPGLHGVVVGGQPSEEVEREVAARDLGGAIEFHPYLPPPQLAAQLQRFDVLAISSHQEGLGIAFLEAMACGAPVVSTRCGGPEEYVRAGVNGELADAADEIAAHLVALVGDRELRSRLGEAARRTVVDSYAWPRVREIFARELAALEAAGANPSDGALE